MSFPITLNGITIMADEIYDTYINMYRNKQKTIVKLVEMTGCETEDAKEVLEDILHMRSLQKNPPKAEVKEHHYTTVVVSDTVDTKLVPKCPTCGSTNLKKLDVIDRGLSFAVWGFGSKKIGKSFKCKNCGYTF